jgi:hypothetical protein
MLILARTAAQSTEQPIFIVSEGREAFCILHFALCILHSAFCTSPAPPFSILNS